ncbi:MAG: hydrolase [Lachnospiraceae bacterium]|nr:hydrolase [Lachnospiraceae bacterium]
MNYYIADPHFGHENVLKFDNRPFSSVDEMDEILITQWNAVVKDTDDVYIIGDFIYKSKKPAAWYLKQLKGRKHLIQGNHDHQLLKDEELVKEFVSIDKMTYVKDGDYTIVLCHFPIAEWNKYWRGSWHIVV